MDRAPASAPRGAPVSMLPLCVELDSGLSLSDRVQEGLLRALRRWDTARRLLGWLPKGRAYVRARLLEGAAGHPALLPFRSAVLAYLDAERKRGRRIVLVADRDHAVASRIAEHLGLFDEVILAETTGARTGPAKAEVLARRFGERGFTYAGTSATDIDVWRRAGGAVVIGAPGDLAAQAAAVTRVETVIDEREPRLRAVLRALRPHQWSKNLLVFVPIVTAGAMFEAPALLKAVLIFAAFSAAASAIYLFNDLADLDADRRHPRKRRRPFASGALPIVAGLALGPLLLLLGLGLGALAGDWSIVALYALSSIAYSTTLKARPIVDLFMLATLYSLRLFGGGEATGHRVSMWLLAFSSFLFLSLAAVKRVGELQDMLRHPRSGGSRRGYSTADLPMLTMFGVASAFSSSIVLALYVQSQHMAAPHAHSPLMLGIVPLILFWQCRLWLATARGYMHDDPIVYAAKDWVSWLTAACVVVVFALSMISRALS